METVKSSTYTLTDKENQVAKYGAESLNDADLLAVLLGEEDRAKEFFETFGGLAGVVHEKNNVLQYNGATLREAVLIRVIHELANRMYYAEQEDQRIQITSPEDVNAYVAPKLRHLTKEAFLVVSLDNTKKIISIDKISDGGKTATIVDTAEVMKIAVLNNANSIVLAHNHPSGNNKASTADIQLTKRIAECGKLFGIPVDDHVIVAGYNFVSLRMEGLF